MADRNRDTGRRSAPQGSFSLHFCPPRTVYSLEPDRVSRKALDMLIEVSLSRHDSMALVTYGYGKGFRHCGLLSAPLFEAEERTISVRGR